MEIVKWVANSLTTIMAVLLLYYVLAKLLPKFLDRAPGIWEALGTIVVVVIFGLAVRYGLVKGIDWVYRSFRQDLANTAIYKDTSELFGQGFASAVQNSGASAASQQTPVFKWDSQNQNGQNGTTSTNQSAKAPTISPTPWTETRFLGNPLQCWKSEFEARALGIAQSSSLTQIPKGITGIVSSKKGTFLQDLTAEKYKAVFAQSNQPENGTVEIEINGHVAKAWNARNPQGNQVSIQGTGDWPTKCFETVVIKPTQQPTQVPPTELPKLPTPIILVVTPTPSPIQTAQSKPHKVVVGKDGAYLFTRASTAKDIRAFSGKIFPAGTRFEFLRDDGSFYVVLYEGVEYWVFQKNASKIN